MENAKIENMYDLSQTIAGEYLAKFTYPEKISGWQKMPQLQKQHV